MRFISTKTHGYLDYIMGVVMIVAPWLFGFAAGGAETTIFVVLGVAVLVYSLFTRYELGAVKAIPMSGHLALDFVSGVLLAASPWLFGFSHLVSTPHVVFGLAEVGASLLTQTRSTWHHEERHAHL